MQNYNMRVGASAAIIQDGAILLIAFQDSSSGYHYNLPGGGIEAGETLHEVLTREAREEACAEIEIGPLLLVTEYEPERNAQRYGEQHKLNLIFGCQLKAGCEPRLPEKPDQNQVGVEWVRLDVLARAPLLPPIGAQLLAAYQRGGDKGAYVPMANG
jgi:8-oxo-dGTP diphosphatase